LDWHPDFPAWKTPGYNRGVPAGTKHAGGQCQTKRASVRSLENREDPLGRKERLEEKASRLSLLFFVYFPTVTDPPTVWLVVVYDPLTVTPLVQC